jgi:hypothetical protein
MQMQGTYVRNELVKLGLAHEVLNVEQEVEALLVGDAGESIIGVLALQVGDELCELVVLAKVLHRILQRLPSDDGGEVAVSLAVTRKVRINQERVLIRDTYTAARIYA